MFPTTMKILPLVFVLILEFKTVPSIASSAAPLNMNIDTNDFKSLVLNNGVFVDKSLLIEEFIQMQPSSFVPLIIRPPGWGKSTNLDMIRRFFEIEIDSQGNRIPKNKTINDKLFCGGAIDIGSNVSKKLDPLKISYIFGYLEYLGKTPVILLKLENVTGKCYREIEQSIKSRVVDAFQSHFYLCNYTHPRDTSTIFQGYNVRNYLIGDFNTTELKRSIFTLSGLLHQFFQKRVVILIDDYDTPLTNAFLEFGDNQKEYDQVVDLLDSMYQWALKGNIFLYKALVTGIMRMSFDTAAKPIARLDNLETCTFHCRRFSQYYGFTRTEVRDLLERIPIAVNAELINSWYGGYGIDEEIYLNERLVMKCLSKNGSVGFYDESAVTANPLIDRIFATDEMQPKIQSLILGQMLDFESIFHMMRTRWQSLNKLVVLLHYGYLNKTRSMVASGVAIPNQEIQHIYEMKVLQWVSKKFGINGSEFFAFAELLGNGSMQQFRDILPKYLSNADAVKLLQSGEKKSKALYNAITIALQAALGSSHEKHNIPQSDRFILIPKLGRSDTAIIFRYKVAKAQNDLISTAEAGLSEINSSQNDTNLKTYSNICNVRKISVAFCGINAIVKDETGYISNSTTNGSI